jgi:hypothetical protein
MISQIGPISLEYQNGKAFHRFPKEGVENAPEFHNLAPPLTSPAM